MSEKTKKNYFEHKIYQNLKKVKKTLLVGKFNLDKVNIDNLNLEIETNTNTNYSIMIKKIYLELNDKSEDYGWIESLISKMKIILSTNPDPKSTNNIITIPGYICGFKFIEKKLLELDIWFENFLPNGLVIPIDNSELDPNSNHNPIKLSNSICKTMEKHFCYEGEINFYLMILFGNLIKDDLIESSYVEYNIIYSNLNDNELYFKFNVKKDAINEENRFNYFIGHKTIFIQDTQSENFSYSKIANSKLIGKTQFNFMCRGFWIKMNKIDYSNLKKFKIQLNGQDRFDMDIFQLELLDLDKKYIDDSVVFFFNLELESKKWGLPKTISESKMIYLNSINLSRIDSTRFIFEFESNLMVGEYIGITALNSNLLGIQNIKYEKIFIN